MPIIEGQKNLIRSAIDFLFDFPEDDNELTQQISLIKEALTKEVPENHDYFALRKFFRNPTETLHGIEKFNNEFTIAEVQLAILDICLEAVNKAATKDRHIYDAFKNWLSQIESILIPAIHHEEKFSITQPSQTMVNLPWENMQEKHEIFSCSLYLNEQHTGVNVVVQVNIPNDTTIKLTTLFTRPDPEYLTSNYVSQYLYNLIPSARQFAYNYAKKKIVEYLFQKNIINQEEYLEAQNSTTNSRILCHEYYLEQLRRGGIDITFLNILTEHGVNVFCHESLVELLAKNYCSIEQALQMQPHHLLLLSSYYKALRDKTIDIEKIIAVEEDHASLLQLPFVVNFIPFEIAAKLPNYFLNLFKNTILSEYFSNHPIDLVSLASLNEAQCLFLAQKDISLLIANQVLTFKDVLQMEVELHATLKRPKINRLVMNNHLSIYDLQDMSINAIKMLAIHPYLSEWLAAGVISAGDIQPKNLARLYTTVYAERLFAIQKQNPFVLFGKADCILSLSSEIRAAAHHAELSIYNLQEKITKELVARIKQEVINFLEGDIPREEAKAFKKILKACETNQSSWNEVLAHCIEKSNGILEDLKYRYSYFSKTPDIEFGTGFRFFHPRNYLKDRPLYKFCSGMLTLAEFAVGLPQQKALENKSMVALLA